MMSTLEINDAEINDELFSLFSDLIYRTSDIKLSNTKKSLLTSRLVKRLKKYGVESLLDYYNIVKKDDEELVEMLNCISTNTTKFFREHHHFEYLKNRIIPDLLKSKYQEKAIRIWSAGCSTGEEPYSIAITVHEVLRMNGIKAESWDIKILATDISTKVLETAEAGIYGYRTSSSSLPSIPERCLPLTG